MTFIIYKENIYIVFTIGYKGLIKDVKGLTRTSKGLHTITYERILILLLVMLIKIIN
uniref:Uncharacterized protein n=1 Tax=viral metagenome TaxID=1070528 RepID=A0A6C0EVI9_9ZZZZ